VLQLHHPTLIAQRKVNQYPHDLPIVSQQRNWRGSGIRNVYFAIPRRFAVRFTCSSVSPTGMLAAAGGAGRQAPAFTRRDAFATDPSTVRSVKGPA